MRVTHICPSTTVVHKGGRIEAACMFFAEDPFAWPYGSLNLHFSDHASLSLSRPGTSCLGAWTRLPWRRSRELAVRWLGAACVYCRGIGVAWSRIR